MSEKSAFVVLLASGGHLSAPAVVAAGVAAAALVPLEGVAVPAPPIAALILCWIRA